MCCQKLEAQCATFLSHGSYNTEWPSHFFPSKSAGKSCEKGKKCASQSQNKILVRHLSRLTSWSLVVLRDVRMTMVPLACDCTVQACPAFCQVTSPKLSCNSFKKLSKFRFDQVTLVGELYQKENSSNIFGHRDYFPMVRPWSKDDFCCSETCN